MNELQIYSSEEFGSVRTVEINEEPWFVGKDVSDILGYAEVANMRKLLEDDEYMEINPQKPEFKGFVQNGSTFRMLLINESGLYQAIFHSTLEGAKRFRHWVTSEVLPSIRKTGGYQLPQTYSEALRALADKAEEAERLAIENNRMKPKADFYDAVASSKDVIDIGQVAKILAVPGIGRNKLFTILKDRRILMSSNVPYQKYIDKGYFKLIEQKFTTPDGETRVSVKTVVYQKGVDAIRKLLETV